MAKTPSAKNKEETRPAVLPLPEAVIRHHGGSVLRAMEQWLEQKKVPPVLLITGPSGVGKRSMVHFIAQWLLCEKSGFAKSDASEMGLFGAAPASPSGAGDTPRGADGMPRPCGECGSCQRAVAGRWVDFTEISTDSDDVESTTLKIDQFRNLKSTLGFGAFEGAFKITLIRDAEKMTPQAANSILKILEEPPPGWLFFLTASDPSLLLPTLVSRCQTLRLRPFPKDTLLEILSQSEVPKERRAAAVEGAQGSWGRALELSQDDTWELRQSVMRFVKQPAQEIQALVEWAAQDAANLESFLDQMEQVTAELALKEPFYVAQAERLFKARQESRAPLNRKILVQDLLMPWLDR